MQGSNKSGFSQDTLNEMLKLAGKKLGMAPEQLKEALNDPKKASEIISSIDKSGKAKAAASNPKAFEEFLNSNPKAKKMFNDLMGEKKN